MRFIILGVMLGAMTLSPTLARADYYRYGCGPHCHHERWVAHHHYYHHYDHYYRY
jgi:hypothetical protein